MRVQLLPTMNPVESIEIYSMAPMSPGIVRCTNFIRVPVLRFQHPIRSSDSEQPEGEKRERGRERQRVAERGREWQRVAESGRERQRETEIGRERDSVRFDGLSVSATNKWNIHPVMMFQQY